MEWMFNPLWLFLQNQIKNMLLSICQMLMILISAGTSGFWSDPTIGCFLSFSKWANMTTFAVAFAFMLFDIGEELASGKGVDYGVVFSNILKALLFVSFNSMLAELSMLLAEIVTTRLNLRITADATNLADVFNAAYGGSLPFLILLIFAITIGCLAFFVMTVIRYGSMFVLILSSSFYIPDILRGDTTSIGAWLRQMVAISGTYIFQYITFYLGLFYFAKSNIIMGAICWAGMASAEKVLQKFSYSTGTKGVFGAATSMAGQGITFLASKI